MAQLTYLEALEGNTKNRNRSASAGAQSNLPRPAALNQDRNRESSPSVTEALCADLLTRDVAAADHLVKDCTARALEKIGLCEQGTDLRAWMFLLSCTIYRLATPAGTRGSARFRNCTNLIRV